MKIGGWRLGAVGALAMALIGTACGAFSSSDDPASSAPVDASVPAATSVPFPPASPPKTTACDKPAFGVVGRGPEDCLGADAGDTCDTFDGEIGALGAWLPDSANTGPVTTGCSLVLFEGQKAAIKRTFEGLTGSAFQLWVRFRLGQEREPGAFLFVKTTDFFDLGAVVSINPKGELVLIVTHLPFEGVGSLEQVIYPPDKIPDEIEFAMLVKLASGKAILTAEERAGGRQLSDTWGGAPALEPAKGRTSTVAFGLSGPAKPTSVLLDTIQVIP